MIAAGFLTMGRSYDVVLPRIQQMVARNPVSYYVRGTFSRGNLDFTQDLEHLIACGFTNLSLEPAVGPYEEFAIGEEVIPGCWRNMTAYRALWAHYQAGQEINYFHFNLIWPGSLSGPAINRLWGRR